MTSNNTTSNDTTISGVRQESHDDVHASSKTSAISDNDLVNDVRASACPAKGSSLDTVIKLFPHHSDRTKLLPWIKNLKFLAFDSLDTAARPGSYFDSGYVQFGKPLPAPAGKEVCKKCEDQYTPKVEHRCDSHFTVSYGGLETPGNRSHLMCNGCMTNIDMREAFRCRTCNGGQDCETHEGHTFDLCRSCLDKGVYCLNTEHTLQRIQPDRCPHVEKHVCAYCDHVPIFPNSGSARNLQIVKLRDEVTDIEAGPFPHTQDSVLKGRGHCTDFVAVSYCWGHASNENDVPEPYMVRDPYAKNLDDRYRPARANSAVLDRAINFARENGLRLIWIDQECLDQKNPEEMAEAVQFMDWVYMRAKLSIGLMETVIEQEYISALMSFGKWSESGIASQLGWPTGEPVDDMQKEAWLHAAELFEFFSLISLDTWLTRAWIIQEAFSAGKAMFLLFRKGEGSVTEDLDIFCQDFSMSEAAWNMENLTKHIRQAHFLLDVEDDVSRRASLRRFTELPPGDLIRTVFKCLEGKFLSLMPWKGRHNRCIILRNSYKTDRKCSAATALSYLKSRESRYNRDWVAILANMCNYSARFSTEHLIKENVPLSASLLALALKNGDLSLLHEYAYPEWTQSPLSKSDSFSWAPPESAPLSAVSYTKISPHIPTVPRVLSDYNLTRTGLEIPAYLWKVKREVDLTYIRDKFHGQWVQLKRQQTHLTIDTAIPWEEATEQEREKIMQQLPDASEETIKNSQIIFAATCSERLKIKFYQEVILEIIMFLLHTGRSELADAIWNSTQGSEWYCKGHSMDALGVPATTRVFNIMQPNVSLLTRKVEESLIHLDSDGEGDYHQSWLVERILEHGFLWYGDLVRRACDDAFCYGPDPCPLRKKVSLPTELEIDLLDDIIGMMRILLNNFPDYRAMFDRYIHEEDKKIMINSLIEGITPPATDHKELETDEQMLARAIELSNQPLDAIGSAIGDDAEDTGTASDHDEGFDLQKALTMVTQNESRDRHEERLHAGRSLMKMVRDLTLRCRHWTAHMQEGSIPGHLEQLEEIGRASATFMRHLVGDTDETAMAQRLGGLRAFFDVDGPCAVLTAYDPVLELFPRPETRSFKVSWIVESVSQTELGESLKRKRGKEPMRDPAKTINLGHENERTEDTLRKLGSVRGMWSTILYSPLTLYNLV